MIRLLIISDGKKGHENQTLGLAEAIARRSESTYEILRIPDKKTPAHPPHAILAAGHTTHLPLLKLGWKYHVPTILIMRPTLPTFLFTRCLIPEHDLTSSHPPKNVIPTKGSLNRIPETLPPKKNSGLIMLGGPSKHFQWHTPPLLHAIRTLVTSRPDLTWTLGDSRRTPPETLAAIHSANLPLTIVPHQDSGPNWLRDTFLTTREAWLTPDSSSMLFEALTAGCHLGTLPLPPNHTRLSRAHHQLAASHLLTPFQHHNPLTPLPAPPEPLHETARCATLLLSTLLK